MSEAIKPTQWDETPCENCGEPEGRHYVGRCYSVHSHKFYTPVKDSSPSYRQLAERVKELEEALRKYEDVRDDMFTFFMSNGIFNQWGKRYDCSALNNAHLQASAALSKALPNTVAEVK